jgi:hypothetical protein
MGTISFDYLPDSPLSHQWELAKKDARFEASASKDRASVLTIEAEDAIDYPVEKYQRVRNRVRFSAKLSQRTYVYVKVQFRAPGMTHGPDWGWIACDTGVAEPRRESRDERVISRIPEKNGWTQFDLFLPDEVQRTYGQVEVLDFKDLLGFRLRGELSISPILLFRDEIEGKVSRALIVQVDYPSSLSVKQFVDQHNGNAGRQAEEIHARHFGGGVLHEAIEARHH